MGNRWKMEAVFPSRNLRIFSGDFWPFPVLSFRKQLEITEKKIRKSPSGNIASMKSPKILETGRFLAGFNGVGIWVMFKN